MMVPGALRVLAAVSACAAALVACGGSHHAPPTTSAGTPSASAPTPRVDPLTGGSPSNHSVVAVKIDDTAAGRPQVGIDAADLVYVEQVEGGLTRLLAVYDTRLPVVAPVRSTRVGDTELAAQFGPIDYVASGGSQGELAPLDASKLRTAIGDRGAAGFGRDPNRRAPFNLTANLAAIAARLNGPKATSIGLAWSRQLVNAGTRPGAVVDTRVGTTRVVFDWNAKLRRYVRVIDGAVQHAADGAVIATPNVVVQFCQVTTFLGDIDQSGNPAKVTHTVGQGRVAVFRDGHRIDGTWRRSSAGDGTHLTDAQGRPIGLAPGGAWFVLAAIGAPLG